MATDEEIEAVARAYAKAWKTDWERRAALLGQKDDIPSWDEMSGPQQEAMKRCARAAIEAVDRVRGWQPIETAPKDGARILLARFGWVWDQKDAEPGTRRYRDLVFGEAEDAERVYQLLWSCAGFWSKKWNNWNDGVEPSGLNGPTHWQPLPEPPEKNHE